MLVLGRIDVSHNNIAQLYVGICAAEHRHDDSRLPSHSGGGEETATWYSHRWIRKAAALCNVVQYANVRTRGEATRPNWSSKMHPLDTYLTFLPVSKAFLRNNFNDYSKEEIKLLWARASTRFAANIEHYIAYINLHALFPLPPYLLRANDAILSSYSFDDVWKELESKKGSGNNLRINKS